MEEYILTKIRKEKSYFKKVSRSKDVQQQDERNCKRATDLPIHAMKKLQQSSNGLSINIKW